MEAMNVTVQLVTGSERALDATIAKLQENFSYVSKVMLVLIDVHPLDVSGPLFGVVLDVPNVWMTAHADGDYFVPLGLSHRAPAEQWFFDVIASLEDGEVAAHSVLLKQAYMQGPGVALHQGDGSKVILKNQPARVLKYWERPDEDDDQAEKNW